MSGVPPGIVGAWLHSYEEDTATAAVYRPAGHPFRPSRRPRRGLEFRADGTFLESRPGPDDRPRHVAGRWEDVAGGALRVTFTAEEGGAEEAATRTITVLSCTGDRLTIAK